MKNFGAGTGIALTATITASTLCLTGPTPAHASPGTPAPTASPRSTPVATATPKGLLTPVKYQLSLKGQRQSTNYYCVPASSSMSLSSFGIKVSQSTLAKKMKTTSSGGTKGANAVPVLNAYVKSKGYKYTIPTDADGNALVLMKRVSEDIGDLHRAPVIAVYMEQLPWNKGKVKGTEVGHAIIAYGYNKLTGTITVYDPWKPTGGSHTIAAATLANTLQPGGNMYDISKL
ncbi:C39 family peptidase [Nonomuraea sp. K274]|uniref:C39 family peptidase n=1 Tax=Nonomuraea cypriaca TaxID=1187855 RepID=A0A931EYM7_9ACTN|nr:C39 family peptidase [Nonomuraea cypriaca]MBF8186667.1 C39 family peptidase [Nonomuraea cypriaca]